MLSLEGENGNGKNLDLIEIEAQVVVKNIMKDVINGAMGLSDIKKFKEHLAKLHENLFNLENYLPLEYEIGDNVAFDEYIHIIKSCLEILDKIITKLSPVTPKKNESVEHEIKLLADKIRTIETKSTINHEQAKEDPYIRNKFFSLLRAAAFKKKSSKTESRTNINIDENNYYEEHVIRVIQPDSEGEAVFVSDMIPIPKDEDMDEIIINDVPDNDMKTDTEQTDLPLDIKQEDSTDNQKTSTLTRRLMKMFSKNLTK